MKIDNEYLSRYKKEFEDTHHLMIVNNHHVHNPDPEYWGKLLNDVRDNAERWKGKRALNYISRMGANRWM